MTDSENPRARSIRLHEEFEVYYGAREMERRLQEPQGFVPGVVAERDYSTASCET